MLRECESGPALKCWLLIQGTILGACIGSVAAHAEERPDLQDLTKLIALLANDDWTIRHQAADSSTLPLLRDILVTGAENDHLEYEVQVAMAVHAILQMPEPKFADGNEPREALRKRTIVLIDSALNESTPSKQ